MTREQKGKKQTSKEAQRKEKGIQAGEISYDFIEEMAWALSFKGSQEIHCTDEEEGHSKWRKWKEQIMGGKNEGFQEMMGSSGNTKRAVHVGSCERSGSKGRQDCKALNAMQRVQIL